MPYRPPIAWLTTALVCEDQADVSTYVDELLREWGANDVWCAASNAEAIAVLEAHGRELSLVVSDMHLADGLCEPTVAAIKRHAAQAAVVAMTDKASLRAASRLIYAGAHGFLEKPFGASELHETLTALDRRALATDRVWDLVRAEGFASAFRSLKEGVRDRSLRESRGNVSLAARLAGVSRAYFYKLLDRRSDS